MRGARSCIVGTLVCMLIGVLLIQGAASFTDPETTIEIDDEMVWEGWSLPHADVHSHWSCGYWVFDNIYETLYTYPWDSVDATPSQPLLASGLDISEDGLNYTFTLREGVRFHDGTPFNATCVQMNFWRILGHGWDESFGPAWMVAEPILGGQAVQDAVFDYGDGSPQHIGNWTNWVENSGAIEVLDTYTVRIQLAYPYSPFLAVVSYTACSIISPTFFMAHGGMAPGGDIRFMALNYCGTGPYKLLEAVSDGDGGYDFYLTLNEDYWRMTDIPRWPFPPDQGHIKDITIKQSRGFDISPLTTGIIDALRGPLPSNISELWNRLPPPEANLIWVGSNNGHIQSIYPTVRVWQGYPEFFTSFFGFNLHTYLNMSGEVTLSPWVNKDLRYAMSYAFDYQTYMDTQTDGRGIQAQGPLPRGMFGHDNDLFMFEYDLANAVEYWNLAMADGLDDIWLNNSYSLVLYHNNNKAREGVCNLIKDGLESILAHSSSTKTSWGGDATHDAGTLKIEIELIDWTTYINALRNKTLPIYFLGWSPNYSDPDDYRYFVKTNGTYPNRIGLDQDPTWDAETVDGWVEQAASTIDPSTREVLYHDIQEAIVGHAAYIWCYQWTSFHMEGVKYDGYAFHPMRGPYFYHYYNPLSITSNFDLPLMVLVPSAIIVSIIALVLYRTRLR